MAARRAAQVTPDFGAESFAEKPPQKQVKVDVRRFVQRLQATPVIVGLATLSFAAFCIGLCITRPGSDVAAADFDRQVGLVLWPVPAHLSCFLLNLKSFHFQTAPLKRKFMMLNLYSSSCAVVSYWLMAYAAMYRLVNYDAWMHCFIYFRPIQWIHTTPAMLHQILMLGDQSTFQCYRLHGVNMLMLICGLTGHVIPNRDAASAVLTICWLVFTYEMWLVHNIFLAIADAAASMHYVDVREADGKQVELARDVEKGFSSFEQGKRMEIRMIRHLHVYTLMLWVSFGIVDILHTTDAVSLLVIEHVWGVLDVAAKVLFSSSLTMTGVISLYEAEKQEAWLAEQRAAAMADAATTANREVLMANAIAGDKNVDQAGRIEELSKLVQEGWALVVGDMLQDGTVPQYDGVPMKIPSLASSSCGEENTMREAFIAHASTTLREMGMSTDIMAIKANRSTGNTSGLLSGSGFVRPAPSKRLEPPLEDDEKDPGGKWA